MKNKTIIIFDGHGSTNQERTQFIKSIDIDNVSAHD